MSLWNTDEELYAIAWGRHAQNSAPRYKVVDYRVPLEIAKFGIM